MGLLGECRHLILRDEPRKFLEEKIPCIQKEDIFFVLLLFLDPGCSLGQTAKTILLVSGGAGVDLPVHVIAVEEAERLSGCLGVQG